MHWRLLLAGLGIWAGATIALRLLGQYLLRPHAWTITLILLAVSFPGGWPGAVQSFPTETRSLACGRSFSLALPTLLLDPFSSVFFPAVFPNMAPEMAGVFGGWMLWCCAGALAGVIVRR